MAGARGIIPSGAATGWLTRRVNPLVAGLKVRSTLFALAASLLLTVGSPSSAAIDFAAALQQAEKARQDGYELLAQGRRPDAILSMRTALGLERSASNLLGLATALSAGIEQQQPVENEINEAVSLLRESESMAESPAAARLGCILAAYKQDVEWMGIEVKRYQRLDPTNPWAFFFGASHAIMIGDRKAAEADLNRARDLGLPAWASGHLAEQLENAPLPSPQPNPHGSGIRRLWVVGFLVFLVVGWIVHTGRGRAHGEGSPSHLPKPPGTGRVPERLLLLAGVTVLALLPFSDKAFHIDDPVFVWVAKQIEVKPLDPYGFGVNWYGTIMPMSDVNKNPPLTSYYIAAVGAVAGMGERAVHIAFLAQAVFVILGTYLLAERFCRRPLLAALFALCTPVFLVSSSTAMSDTLMLAFWMTATYTWVTGLERGSWALLLVSSLCVAMSALSKYFGVALIPLLLVYAIAVRRRVPKEAAFMLVPVVLLGLYQVGTHHLYGRGLLGDAASYASTVHPMSAQSFPERLLVGASFTGGCLGLAWLLALVPWKRRALLSVAGLGLAVTAIALAAWKLGGHAIGGNVGDPWAVAAHLGFFVAGGAVALFLGGRALFVEKDPASLLLGLWILGTFGFATLVNWSTNGRSILPMIPAVGILIARRIGEASVAPSLRQLIMILGAAAVLALGVTHADALQADSARRAAREIDQKFGGRPGHHWFSGHWGFQYYMEARGWKHLDEAKTILSPGDLVVSPRYNSGILQLAPRMSRPIDTLDVPVGGWIATMRPEMGASFYTDLFGPLPFAFGRVPFEPYQVLEVVSPR